MKLMPGNVIIQAGVWIQLANGFVFILLLVHLIRRKRERWTFSVSTILFVFISCATLLMVALPVRTLPPQVFFVGSPDGQGRALVTIQQYTHDRPTEIEFAVWPTKHPDKRVHADVPNDAFEPWNVSLQWNEAGDQAILTERRPWEESPSFSIHLPQEASK